MDYTEKEKIKRLLVLIDFEKAFDSISWKFLYNVLKFLGFGPDFILWVKLLNTDVHASVIQAGVKSDYIKIERERNKVTPLLHIFIFSAVKYYIIWFIKILM